VKKSGRQAFATLGATTINQSAARTGGHASTKAMTACAANSAWLIGKAHGFSPVPKVAKKGRA